MNTDRDLQALLDAAAARGEKSVVIAPGDYTLNEPIMLTGAHSGLTIQGEGARLLGGCTLDHWMQEEGGFWRAPVPEGCDPAMLLVNGRAAERARFPAQGTLTYLTDAPSDMRWMSSTNGGWNRTPTHDELTCLRVNPDDIPADMDVENALITLWHEWDESTVRAASFDRESGDITLLTETEHPAGAFQKKSYALWNVREGMTRPGQWYFDRRRGCIVYAPQPGDVIDSFSACIPLIQSALVLDGADGVTLSGLEMTLCNAPARRAGLRGVNFPGAIEAHHCRELTIDSVHVHDTAAHAIRLDDCPGARCASSTLENCGAGGLFEWDCYPALVENNLIRRIGLSANSAIGIHAGGRSQLVYVQDGFPREGGGVVISHNTLTDMPYCAITCNGGPDNIIEYNRIVRCMTVLNDGAAIYCSRARETLLRGNLVSEIRAERAYAYYLDEASCLCRLEGNASDGLSTPFQSHLSAHCTLSGNVFIAPEDMTLRIMRSHHFAFTANIFCCGGRFSVLDGCGGADIAWPNEHVVRFDGNMIACDQEPVLDRRAYGNDSMTGVYPLEDSNPLPAIFCRLDEDGRLCGGMAVDSEFSRAGCTLCHSQL